MKARLLNFVVGSLFVGQGFAAGTKVFEYSLGRELQTMPAVDHDGTIFVGGKGAVAALSAVGVEKWKVELSPGSQSYIGGITVSDDRIYVTSMQGLYALSKAGAELWTNSMSITNSKVALDGPENLYVVSADEMLRALRADGSERWSGSVEAPGLPFPGGPDFGPVVGLNGMVFTTAGRLKAFSSNGEKLWTVDNLIQSPPVVNEDGSIYFSVDEGLGTSVRRYGMDGTQTWSNPFFSAKVVASPVVGPDKTLYVPIRPGAISNDQGLIAFRDDGTKKWEFKDFPILTSPAVAADGTIYVVRGSFGSEVVALDPNGSRIWSYTNGVQIVKGLNIGVDGSVLLAQTNGTLIALSGNSAAASGVWPMYGRDPRQTSQQRLPVILTMLPVEEIGTNSALFESELNPRGNAATVHFEYSSSGPVIETSRQNMGATNGTAQVSQSVTGLSAGTLYTVWLVSSNRFGVLRSEALSFRTLGEAEEDPPVLATLEAAATGGGTVKFSGDGTIAISTPIEFVTNAVIDANGHRVVLTGNGQSSLLRLRAGVELTLKGLWLVDGKAPQVNEGGNITSRGGAIVNPGGDLSLVYCVLSNNLAHVVHPGGAVGIVEAAGGAIWQTNGNLSVQSCQFINNRVTGTPWTSPTFPSFGGYPRGRGGALALNGGGGEIIDSIFKGNQAPTGQPAEGGAIFFEGSDLLVTGSEFMENYAAIAPRGACVFVGAGTLVLTNSTLAHNLVVGSVPNARWQLDGSAFGGALFNAGTSHVRNSSFLTNQTVGGMGGGSFLVPSGPSAGAGIYNSGTLGVVNSTFSGSSSTASFNFPPHVNETLGAASALYSEGGVANVTNSTVAWNPKGEYAVRGANETNLVLKNTLLADGAATASGFTDAGHNMSSDAAPFTQSTSRSNVNARLGPIGNYGGRTLVYPLMLGSPAIDAADDAAAPTIDQRGRTRPFGAHADIGSFESSPPFYVWGRIGGYHDPSTTLTVGTNVVAADTNGFFVVGPLSLGTNEIAITATNALFGIVTTNAPFQPNPLMIDVQADEELRGVTSFKLHTLTYVGVVTTPPGFELGAFIFAGLPGEQWKFDMSYDLKTWMNATTYTLNEAGLAEIRVPNEPVLFMKATPAD